MLDELLLVGVEELVSAKAVLLLDELDTDDREVEVELLELDELFWLDELLLVVLLELLELFSLDDELSESDE